MTTSFTSEEKNGKTWKTVSHLMLVTSKKQHSEFLCAKGHLIIISLAGTQGAGNRQLVHVMLNLFHSFQVIKFHEGGAYPRSL